MLQSLAYLVVIFGLLPLVVIAGLAMSPRLNAVCPGWVDLLGGRQSARTLHFLAALGLVLFVVVHVFEVVRRRRLERDALDDHRLVHACRADRHAPRRGRADDAEQPFTLMRAGSATAATCCAARSPPPARRCSTGCDRLSQQRRRSSTC